MDPDTDRPLFDPDTDPPCLLRTGEIALIVRGGYVLPDGRMIPASAPCTVEPGAGWRVHYDERPATRGGTMPDPMPEPVPVPGEVVIPTDPSLAPPAPPAIAAPPAVPAPAPAPTVAPPPLPALTGDEADLGQVLGVGQVLADNPWAPVIMVVLALVAVLGGRKAWTYYGERAQRAHELEMRRLDIQAQQAGLNGAQPPPCAVKQVEVDRRLAELAARLEGVERRSAMFADLDPEAIAEIDKRVKRLERKAAKPEAT